MTAEAGNRIIAEFMGAELTNTAMGRFYRYKTAPTINSCLNWDDYAMQYHSSWDWLLPVWAKIQNIGADLGSSFKHHWERFHVGIDKGDITMCWEAVVEAIEYINTKH